MSEKIAGTYAPCDYKCGQHEPCWGCDSGDYEKPASAAIFVPMQVLKGT